MGPGSWSAFGAVLKNYFRGVANMILPMLVVVHGSPFFDYDDSLARWEQTVTSMLPNDAADVIHTAKAQLQLMESWLALRPDECQFFASLKLPRPPCQLEICLQRYQFH
jgi:hypothetical protein